MTKDKTEKHTIKSPQTHKTLLWVACVVAGYLLLSYSLAAYIHPTLAAIITNSIFASIIAAWRYQRYNTYGSAPKKQRWIRSHQPNVKTFTQLCVGAIIVWLGAQILVQRIMERATDTPVAPFDTPPDIYSLITTLSLIVLIAPISEELIFRGFVQEKLSTCTSSSTAILVTALVFSLMHTAPYQMLYTMIIAGILGYTYHITKRMTIPIMLHMITNAAPIIMPISIVRTMPYDIIPHYILNGFSITCIVCGALIIIRTGRTYEKNIPPIENRAALEKHKTENTIIKKMSKTATHTPLHNNIINPS